MSLAAALSDDENEPPDVSDESDDDPYDDRLERPTDRPFDDFLDNVADTPSSSSVGEWSVAPIPSVADWPAGASSPSPPTSSAGGIQIPRPVCSPFPAVAGWPGGGTPVTTSCTLSPVLFKPRLEPRLEPFALPSLSGSMIESDIV